MKQELCQVAVIPTNGASIVVPFFGREVHVYRSGDRIRAAANVCLHFGGPLECKSGRLVCPWHKAVFDMDSGVRIDGPAPAGSRLLFLSTMVEGASLYYVWGE
jgi:nitrite reductase/ring-hydroxylating ferredoxin subunit